jgi:hypothetical protein
MDAGYPLRVAVNLAPRWLAVPSLPDQIQAALIRHGVPPGRLTWIKPRDSWLLDRAAIQPGRQFAKRTLADFSGQLAAVHEAVSFGDLFDRLEAKGCLLRIDTSVDPTMYRCAIVSQAELDALRGIDAVVRMGHVQAIERPRHLEGTLDVRRAHITNRRRFAAAKPPFRDDHIPLHRADLPNGASAPPSSPTSKRRTRRRHKECALCPVPYPPADRLAANDADIQPKSTEVFSDPDMMAWVDAARLNVLHHVTAAVSERAREKIISVLISQLPAINDKLETLLAQAEATV